MNIRYGYAQDIGKRDAQQDAFAILPARPDASRTTVLAVIADGMGGMEEGGTASRLAVEAFVETYSAAAASSVPQALDSALRAANERVCAFAEERGLFEQIGTTLTAVAAGEAGLHWISVGDSRAYLLRGGELSQITSDHVFRVELDMAAAIGVIGEDEALADPQREALTSFIGLEQLPKIDKSLEPYPLVPGDLVLLCTDGLYKPLDVGDILDSLAEDPIEVATRLMEAVLARNDPQQDNATLIALSCHGNGTVNPRRREPLRRRLTLLWGLLIAIAAALALIELAAHDGDIVPRPAPSTAALP